MKSYIDFTVWNSDKERPATKEEIENHIHIVYNEDKNMCSVEEYAGYRLLVL